jgi:hypothetical protein
VAASAPAVARLPYKFDAKAVIPTDNKNRERDAKVLLFDGKATLSDRNDVVYFTMPLDAVVGVYSSGGKQPMWISPSGPAELKVDTGALGFINRGRNWLVVHTKTASLILRVEDAEKKGAINALEDYTGHKVDRIE